MERKAQSIEELQKEADEADAVEAKALEEAAKAEGAKAEKPVATPEPVVTPEPVKVVEPAELETLKQQLQASNDRISELTRRLNSEDGKRGGELNALRHQVEQLTVENKELKAKAEAPKAAEVVTEEADYLRKEFPEIADGVDARTKRVSEEAAKARKAADEANMTLAEIRQARQAEAEGKFFTEVAAAVPDWETINSSPEFLAFCAERIKGTSLTRLEVLRQNRESLSATPIIEVFQDHAASKVDKTGTDEPPKLKKEKPSLESQQTLPGAGAGAGAGSTKPVATRARLRELEAKLFVKGGATREDREEYDRLVDAEESGKLG